MPVFEEGSARISVDKGVFYNAKMSKLRDISVLFLKATTAKEARLLDSTAASGIRAIRYAKECGIRDITALDINSDAARNAKRNAKTNKVRVKILNESIQEFANVEERAFDVIDIDPFGSPAPLVHDILKVSKDGTLLMITATDTATLCGAEGSACLRIYGSRPLHNELCHEVGIRILLNLISREAAQFNFGIEPILSIADMHYMRVFLRLNRGSKQAVESVKKCGFGSYCSNCHNFSYKSGFAIFADAECDYCRKNMQVFGPLWLGNLRDKDVVGKMLTLAKRYPQETQRIIGRIDRELDMPFFYSIPKITSYLKIGSLPIDTILGSLRKKHEVSTTHFEKDSIKTSATLGEVVGAIKAARKISTR